MSRNTPLTVRRLAIGVATATLLAMSASASAATVYLTYLIEASNFTDSNTNPPPSPVSTTVSGTITFAIDDAISMVEQNDIIPDLISGFAITNGLGDTTFRDTTNTRVDALRWTAGPYGDAVVGGIENGNDATIGGSNDFRVGFRFDLDDYGVTSIDDPFQFVGEGNAAFVAGTTTVTLLSASPTLVPVPAAGWLFLSALGGLALGRRRR